MSSVIGVVIIARHGDREGYYQDPARFVHPSLAPFLVIQRHELTKEPLQLRSKRYEHHAFGIRSNLLFRRRPSREVLGAWIRTRDIWDLSE